MWTSREQESIPWVMYSINGNITWNNNTPPTWTYTMLQLISWCDDWWFNKQKLDKIFLLILQYKTKKLFDPLSQPPALKFLLVNNILRPIICSWQDPNNFLSYLVLIWQPHVMKKSLVTLGNLSQWLITSLLKVFAIYLIWISGFSFY